MTTEIAVLNKMAVALAADSAVTVGQRKIYNTVNKLFTLSKYEAVGIMVYGNAEFMGVPWETIIKTYRRQLGSKQFPRLDEYAKDFVAWLEGNRHLFGVPLQEAFFVGMARSLFLGLREAVLEQSSKFLAEKKTLDLKDLQAISSRLVADKLKAAESNPLLPNLPADYAASISQAYKAAAIAELKAVMEQFPLGDEDTDALVRLCGELFARGIQSDGNSGLVIAGFGTDDVFPAIEAMLLEGILCNRLPLKRDPNQSCRVSHDMQSVILPFAQTDEAITFIEGASPAVLEAFTSYISELARAFPKVLVDDIVRIAGKQALTDEHLAALKKDFEKHAAEEPARFAKLFGNFQRQRVVGPLLDVVAALPKDELGAFAESLVTLTSLRRKFSMGPESVGGPVDVAVISKGDGFVWIKRKHYFDSKLNPHFLPNYFREGNLIPDRGKST